MKKLSSEIPNLKGKRIVLKKLTEADAEALGELVRNDAVYKYLPTFLFERKYKDPLCVIRRLYDECLEESLILGVFLNDELCGLVEFYGYHAAIGEISVGCRLAERFWGKGIAGEVLSLMVDYLLSQKKIKTINASTMAENKDSAAVLKKNGFTLAAHDIPEDWGFERPVKADKWIR